MNNVRHHVNRKVLSIIIAAFLCLSLCLCACSNIDELSSTITSSSYASSSTSTPVASNDTPRTQRYTPETVESIPEMAEINFRQAIRSNVHFAFSLLNKVSERGVRFPIELDILEQSREEYYSGYDSLLNYAIRIYRLDNSDGFRTEDGGMVAGGYTDYYIESDYLQKITTYALASPNFSAAAEKVFLNSYSPYHSSYAVMIGDHFNCDIMSFELEWEDRENERIVTVTHSPHNPPDPVTLIYEYIYTKGEDGRYRLLNGNSYYGTKDTPRAKSLYSDSFGSSDIGTATEIVATPISSSVDASKIVGSIGKTILSFDIWDRSIQVSGLDWDNFTLKSVVDFEGKLYGYRLFDTQLYLLFDTKVIVLDENPNEVTQVDLPPQILSAINRPYPIYMYEPYDGIAFGGYDITQDLNTFAYSTEEGLFLLDRQTGQTRRLFEGYIDGMPGNDNVIFTLWNPRFSYDDTIVYGMHSTYEGPSVYAGYLCVSGEKLDLGETYDPETYEERTNVMIAPHNAGLGNYTKWMFWVSSPYFGRNHYVQRTENSLVCGLLTDSNYESGFEIWPICEGDKELIYGDSPDRHFVTVLSDGRIIFGSGNYYMQQYYCTPPYAELV